MTALSDLAKQAAIRLRQEQLRGANAGDLAEQRQCPTHGEYEARGAFKANIGRTIWSRCPACQKADEEAAEAEKARASAAARAASLERALQLSGMPKRFRGKDFAGWTVINPAENTEPRPNPPLDDWLRISLLALLPGWERTRGGRLEVETARELGIPVFALKDVLAGEAG